MRAMEMEGSAQPQRLLCVGISAKFSPDQLAELFKHPTAKMNAGGMPPIDLPPDDMKVVDRIRGEPQVKRRLCGRVNAATIVQKIPIFSRMKSALAGKRRALQL